MIDIQKRALRPLKQQSGVRAAILMQQRSHISHHRQQSLTVGQRLIQHCRELQLIDTVVMREHVVVVIEHLLQRGAEASGVAQITQAQCASCRLVLITGTYASASCTNFVFTTTHLASLIQCHVVGQNQRTGGGNLETVLNRYAVTLQRINLLQQGFRRQHNTIPD